ncbi:unnamed protein product [Rhizophagus irregularis]|nr:unnamed protein product [Rhizophagus irregularis]
MWEISSGQPPFNNHEHDYDLALNIINAFHSKLYDFNIPENIDDFGQSSKQNSKIISNIIKAGSKRLSKVFKKLQINSKSDDDEYNNPNLHSEEQEEFEIPNDGF